MARASPVGRPTAGRRTCPGARPSRGSRPAGSQSDPAARADRRQLLCCTRPCFSMSLSTLTVSATFHKSCPGRGTTGHWYRGAARSGRCGRRGERDAAAEPPRRPLHEAGAPARAPGTARERPPRRRSCATHAAHSCSAGGPPPAACAPSPAGTSPAWTSRLRAAPRRPFRRPAVGPGRSIGSMPSCKSRALRQWCRRRCSLRQMAATPLRGCRCCLPAELELERGACWPGAGHILGPSQSGNGAEALASPVRRLLSTHPHLLPHPQAAQKGSNRLAPMLCTDPGEGWPARLPWRPRARFRRRRAPWARRSRRVRPARACTGRMPTAQSPCWAWCAGCLRRACA